LRSKQSCMKRFLEKNLLPIAIVLGIVFHKQLYALSFATPYLLSLMLFITYSRISWSSIKITRFHYILLGIQYIGSALIYLAIHPFNEVLAQSCMICVLASTATSAPVVTGLLGGSISTVAAYSVISNLSIAFIAPLFFSIIGETGKTLSFGASFGYIFLKVMPILILPFLASLLVQKTAPKLHRKIASAQIVSFYLWAVALTIVLGSVTRFVVSHSSSNFLLETTIGINSLLICLLQFGFGRKIGRKFSFVVAGGQSLGQKNTILAIWLTQTYLNPIASLGPGLYVLWQNLINSWQIWHKNRYEEKSKTS
jgi:BASS family bile acid:Na+ symporter